ncbi:hypothetical protein, partial [Escherichia albertii]|uniref:hypothetical protein n=1 Tax=Escherichia albertii TaxID=208962 RepID=UPI0021D444A3
SCQIQIINSQDTSRWRFPYHYGQAPLYAVGSAPGDNNSQPSAISRVFSGDTDAFRSSIKRMIFS